MDEEEFHKPFNAIPAPVVLLAAAIGLVEAYIAIGGAGLLASVDGAGLRIVMLERFAFFDTVFEAMRAANQWPLEPLSRSLSYAFIGFSTTQVLVGLAFVLALGKAVGEAFGGLFAVLVFCLGSIAGSLAYGFVWDTEVPLAGPFPGAYALIGSFTLLLWLGLGQMGERQVMAFRLIGMLMAIQLLWGVLFGASKDWLADLTGFVTGFALAFVIGPGGWGAFLRRMRARR